VDKAYNKKLRPRVFNEGDLILKKTLPTLREDQKKVFFFFLRSSNFNKMNGDDLPKPNSNIVKKYLAY